MAYFEKGVQEGKYMKPSLPGPSIWNPDDSDISMGRRIVRGKLPSTEVRLAEAKKRGEKENIKELTSRYTELLTYIQQNAGTFSIAENEELQQQLKEATNALTDAKDKVVRGQPSF
jgi:hypothetical protein